MIKRLKLIIEALIAILFLPFIIVLKYLTDFYNTSIIIAYIPFHTGVYLRYLFYKVFLKKVGKNVHISYGTIFTKTNITIGSNVRFGPFNTIASASFGDNVITAQYVHFLSGSNQHGTILNGIPMMKQPGSLKHITIGNDVWVGANCSIMNNIADGCVVGTG